MQRIVYLISRTLSQSKHHRNWIGHLGLHSGKKNLWFISILMGYKTTTIATASRMKFWAICPLQHVENWRALQNPWVDDATHTKQNESFCHPSGTKIRVIKDFCAGWQSCSLWKNIPISRDLSQHRRRSSGIEVYSNRTISRLGKKRRARLVFSWRRKGGLGRKKLFPFPARKKICVSFHC